MIKNDAVGAEDIEIYVEVSTPTKQDKDHSEFCKCLALAIAYSANIGGMGTLTGTPPNLVFKNVADELVYIININDNKIYIYILFIIFYILLYILFISYYIIYIFIYNNINIYIYIYIYRL